MVKKANLKKEISEKVEAFIDLLEKEGVDVDKAFVFGSHAFGAPKPWSDIDVCVVSSQFGKDSFAESVYLAGIASHIDLMIEAHPYSPEDFKEKYDPLADQIRKHGIKVA